MERERRWVEGDPQRGREEASSVRHLLEGNNSVVFLLVGEKHRNRVFRRKTFFPVIGPRTMVAGSHVAIICLGGIRTGDRE